MDPGKLLDHVPQLVKAYGRWPSFAHLVFATARPVALGALLFALYRLWH